MKQISCESGLSASGEPASAGQQPYGRLLHLASGKSLREAAPCVRPERKWSVFDLFSGRERIHRPAPHRNGCAHMPVAIRSAPICRARCDQRVELQVVVAQRTKESACAGQDIVHEMAAPLGSNAASCCE